MIAVSSFSRFLPSLFAGLGALLIVVGSSRYGIGLTTDTALYLSTADSLLSGRGYTTFQGNPLERFPPLYPTILALVGLAWHDLQAVARWINIVCFAALNLVVARWAVARIESRAVVLFVCLTVLFSVPFLDVFNTAISEPLFVLCVVLALFELDAYLHAGHARNLWCSALLAGLAWLTRYVGITLIMTGLLAVFARPGRPWRSRLQDAGLFAALSMLPLAPWLARNYLLAHNLTAEWPPPSATFLSNLSDMAETMSIWILPSKAPLMIRATSLLILVGIGLLSVLWSCGYKGKLDSKKAAWFRTCLLMSGFTILYVIPLYIASSTTMALDGFGNRFLSPIYIPLLLCFALSADYYLQIGTWARWLCPFRKYLVAGLFLWLLYPARYTAGSLRTYLSTGAGAYGTAEWRQSALVNYLADQPLAGTTFTNEPYAVFLLTGKALRESPTEHWYHSTQASDGPSEMETRLAADDVVYLAWFDRSTRDDLYSLDELSSRFALSQTASLTDGALYAVSRLNR